MAAAALSLALCFAGGASAAEPSKKGIFPEEEARLPVPLARDALSLLIPDAELFLAPAGTADRGGVRRYVGWKNPGNFRARTRKEGAAPPMVFLGWGLIKTEEGQLFALAFDQAGRLAGAAVSPKRAMSESLLSFLEGLTGRSAGEAVRRLRAIGAVLSSPGERKLAAAWRALAERYRESPPAAGAPPPSRRILRAPRPAETLKIAAVAFVIALAGFANIALIRRRRRMEREREAEERPRWRR